jgi:hypothetical protein
MVAIGASGILASVLQSVHKLLGVAELQREHDLYSDQRALQLGFRQPACMPESYR